MIAKVAKFFGLWFWQNNMENSPRTVYQLEGPSSQFCAAAAIS